MKTFSMNMVVLRAEDLPSEECCNALADFAYGIDGYVDSGFSWIIRTSYIKSFIEDVEDASDEHSSEEIRKVASELKEILPSLTTPFVFVDMEDWVNEDGSLNY